MLNIKDREVEELGRCLNVNVREGVIYVWEGYDCGEIHSYIELVKLITYLQDIQKEILS